MSVKKQNKIGCVPINNNALDKVFAPLKYLSNFWRSFNLPLINCEIEHDLSWSRDILSEGILNNPKKDANPDSMHKNKKHMNTLLKC